MRSGNWSVPQLFAKLKASCLDEGGVVDAEISEAEDNPRIDGAWVA